MIKTHFAVIPLLCLLVNAAEAQTIFKCVDAQGGTVITNTKSERNCKAVATSPDNAVQPPARPKAAAAATPTPAAFPKVGEATQRARDGDRRMILEQELAREQRGLELARKELADQEALRPPADQLAPYRDRIGTHERNVQALQKELGLLK